MSGKDLRDLSFSNLFDEVLPYRTAKYLENFREKMRAEGIDVPADLLLASKEALEAKLETHASCGFIERADAISLRTAIDRTAKGETSKHRSRSPRRRVRSKGRRNNTRPHGPPPRGPRERQSKPELRAAAERNDAVKVQELLSLG